MENIFQIATEYQQGQQDKKEIMQHIIEKQ